MKKIKLFELTVGGVVKRFYVMMAAVAISGFFELWVLAAILGFAFAVSFILGIGLADSTQALAARVESRPVRLEKREEKLAA